MDKWSGEEICRDPGLSRKQQKPLDFELPVVLTARSILIALSMANKFKEQLKGTRAMGAAR